MTAFVRNHLLVLTFVANAVFFVTGLMVLSRLGTDQLRQWIQDFGVLGPAVYVVIYVALFVIPFNPIPKNVITAIALVGFGPLLALLMTLLGDVVAISLNYWVGARFHPLLAQQWRDEVQRLAARRGWWVLAVSRIVPITEGYAGADFPSYAAGLVRMPWRPFFLATMAPWLIIDVVYFYGLEVLLAYHLLIPGLIAAFALPVALALYRRRANRTR